MWLGGSGLGCEAGLVAACSPSLPSAPAAPPGAPLTPSCFLRVHFGFLPGWASPGLGPPRGDHSPRPSCGPGSRQPDVWCPQGRPQLWPGRCRPPWLSPGAGRGALWGGVQPEVGRGLEKLLCRGDGLPEPSGSISQGGGDPTDPTPQPPTPCMPGSAWAGFLRPSRGSQLAGCVTGEGHSPSLGLTGLIYKEGSDQLDCLSLTAHPAPPGPGGQSRRQTCPSLGLSQPTGQGSPHPCAIVSGPAKRVH